MTVLVEADHPPMGEDMVVVSIHGKVALTRTDRRLLGQGKLDVVIQAECVRCLELVPRVAIKVDFEESFLLHPVGSHKSGMVVYGVTEDGYLDLTHPLREQILVSVPTHPLCRPDCRGLCSQCGENLNLGDCACSNEVIDPRMAALKLLLDK